MLTFITFGIISLLTGMVLGQRFKVLAVVPAIAVTSLAAIGYGIAHSEGLGRTVLLAALAVASLQIGYLVGVAISVLSCRQSHQRAPHRLHSRFPADTARRALMRGGVVDRVRICRRSA